jgi:hypothetical protein
MYGAMAPTIRTGVLLLGFLLGTFEVTFWVIFYTFRDQSTRNETGSCITIGGRNGGNM